MAGVTSLATIYAGANHDLSGWHFVVAILFGGLASLLIVESFYRQQAHVYWHLAATVGALCAIASLSFVALPEGHHAAASGGHAPAGGGSPAIASGNAGLQFAMRPVPREIFRIAFQKRIGLPRPNETPAQLWKRGGVEVGQSNYRMILSNTGSEPVTVVSVRLEVLGSEPRPEGALAYKFTQGAEGLAQLGAIMSQTRPGTIARLYDSSRGIPSPRQRKTTPPYFETTFVHLEPGEVYPGSVTVEAEPQRLIHFRFIAEGSSARHHFVERSPTYSLVGGYGLPSQERYDRVYVEGQFPGVCTATPESNWYDQHLSYGNGGTICPAGAEAPKEIALSDPAAYPTGRFHLDLRLDQGAQSAIVDGVTLGGAPAARPRSSVAMPLLRRLGAWSTCIDRWPVPGYWTAAWEKWGLFLVFAEEDGQDCTAGSRSPVHQIEVSEWGQVVHTDRGAVEIGADPATIPQAIQDAGTVEPSSDEAGIVVPGVSVCDPHLTEYRPQIPSERRGGILAIHVREPHFDNHLGKEVHLSEIDGAITTLPEKEC